VRSERRAELFGEIRHGRGHVTQERPLREERVFARPTRAWRRFMPSVALVLVPFFLWSTVTAGSSPPPRSSRAEPLHVRVPRPGEVLCTYSNTGWKNVGVAFCALLQPCVVVSETTVSGGQSGSGSTTCAEVAMQHGGVSH